MNNHDSIALYKIDQKKNMYRFYRMEILADLFGQVCLIREWGRIGRPGRVMTTSSAEQSVIFAQFEKIMRLKSKNGYTAA